MQALLVGEDLDVADRDRAVRDRDGAVDQHPTGVVTGPAFPQAVGGLAQRRGQADPISEFGQQHCPGMRHHPVPSQVMTGTVLLVVGCTCEVPLLVGIFVP